MKFIIHSQLVHKFYSNQKFFPTFIPHLLVCYLRSRWRFLLKYLTLHSQDTSKGKVMMGKIG